MATGRLDIVRPRLDARGSEELDSSRLQQTACGETVLLPNVDCKANAHNLGPSLRHKVDCG